MIKIVPESENQVINEEYLYTIMFGLKKALTLYEFQVFEYGQTEYKHLSGKEQDEMDYLISEISKIKKLLKEIREAMEG